MSSARFRIKAFAHHLLNSKSRFSIHSPFVYEFCTKVLPHRLSEVGKLIKQRREQLMNSSQQISFTDYGAGADGKPVTRELREMVRSASRKRRSGELLYRICQHYQVRRGVELGTHVGLATLYQMAGGNFERFVTLDGAEATTKIAQEGFREFSREFSLKPEVLTGPFQETFMHTLDLQQLTPDYAFLDGNHRYEPSMEYFYHLLPHMQDGGIMIWDDIYWSEGMQRAWNEIASHPEVTVSMDLFFLGICVIRRNQAKEHFRFRFIEGNF